MKWPIPLAANDNEPLLSRPAWFAMRGFFVPAALASAHRARAR
jgi:hypothetical protein